jgi:hypothetical protein
MSDVARGVVIWPSLSLEANMQFMTVTATSMPYICAVEPGAATTSGVSSGGDR